MQVSLRKSRRGRCLSGSNFARIFIFLAAAHKFFECFKWRIRGIDYFNEFSDTIWTKNMRIFVKKCLWVVVCCAKI